MPNIKSAEKRVRSTARRTEFNRAAKSRVSTLERNFNQFVKDGKKDDAAALLPRVTAAYDKAAKVGVCHPNKANHKKSRLTKAFNGLS